MAGPPLSDDEVYDRLHKALLALGREDGATVRGNTAINGARKMLQLFQLGLTYAVEKASGVLDGEPSRAERGSEPPRPASPSTP